MDDGAIAIRELDTTAPGPDGTPGGGGVVRWRDALITCDDVEANVMRRPRRAGLRKPYPCAARPVGDSSGGGDSGSADGGAGELRRASSALLGATQGPVFLSLTSNISLATGFGYWNVLTRGSAGRLVLRGSPGAATTLDLAGREDAWVWEPPPSFSDPTFAYLYDMTLVNLPYSTHPSSPTDLMVLATLSFSVRSSWRADGPLPGSAMGLWGPRLRLTLCTLVLPDEEVAFLRGGAEEAAAAAADAGTPPGPTWAALSGGFTLSMQVAGVSPVTGEAGSGVLVVDWLELQPAVLLLNCTLLSASAYAALPGAVPLLPQSRVWPPLLLHGNRSRALAQGPSGLAVAPGLEAALAVQERMCGQEPGGAAVTLVARRHDDTVSPGGQGPEDGIAVGGAEVAGPEAGLDSPGSPAAGDVCTVSGYAPELVVGRTFTDLKNLVLYNLAPGGSGTPLEGGDAAWVNSSLPLWYFSLTRSASPGDPAPLLLLDNVTLVVPEPEWRALAAAPLLLDSSSGVLVLASARHYGWYGTHVTVTYTLPLDAPAEASLVPYPAVRLPYQEFAVAAALKRQVAEAGLGAGQMMGQTETPAVGSENRGAAPQSAKLPPNNSSAESLTPAPLAAPEPQDDQAFLQDVSAELGGGDSDLQVSSVLGRGAFGVVYTGRWRSLPVAVKTLVLPEVAAGSEDGQRRRAVLEAAISLSMAHENIVATYTYMLKPLVQQPPSTEDGAADGGGSPGRSAGPDEITVADGGADAYKLYIVQELCNGGSLYDALARGMAGSVRNGGSGRRLALRLALDVARGVAHVHACRIVHGDLKPDNVLLVVAEEAGDEQDESAAASNAGNDATAPEAPLPCPGSAFALPHDAVEPAPAPEPALRDAAFPSFVTAKVADFGLSLPLPEDATHQSKLYQGTPMRLAPEVASHGRLSARSDAWSYGTMLIELFYGCTFDDIAATFMAMLEGSGPAKMEYRKLCTLLLQDMLRTPEHAYTLLTASCFAPEPHNRPTFEHIVSQLEQIMGVAKQE
ncbi:hypothetical protein GPECTOR_38g341 [Gonium pectorale]|uniref:Protein kinase domain-containing protein n=1 Tax=Gonium pectorale TaxID=33097 RepID=A0A150GB99_GONPE|nr:hypothetical protein GPECTOR_38g341 [Gonium pectorale]|eukprot:KXZ47104.1 hypothetical protein GPECTOR_38g341 [Gonium pectorale]